jgi:hypothetical protein
LGGQSGGTLGKALKVITIIMRSIMIEETLPTLKNEETEVFI